jgi:hypothetical protein
VYRGPDGVEIPAPTEPYVRDRLLGGDLAYWRGPAGDAGLFRQGGGDDADLTLIVHAAGVLVRHRDYLAREDRVLAAQAGPAGDRVDVYDGQQTWSIPRRFLVSREMAWTAAAEFMRTGRRASELSWEHGFDPRLAAGPPDDGSVSGRP